MFFGNFKGHHCFTKKIWKEDRKNRINSNKNELIPKDPKIGR